jgi:hypothetical protein
VQETETVYTIPVLQIVSGTLPTWLIRCWNHG